MEKQKLFNEERAKSNPIHLMERIQKLEKSPEESPDFKFN